MEHVLVMMLNALYAPQALPAYIYVHYAKMVIIDLIKIVIVI